MVRGVHAVRVALAMVLAAVVVLVSPQLARAETEPNDTLANATPIGINSTDSGTLTTGDVDYFRVSAVAGNTYVAEVLDVSSSLTDINLYAYNSGGAVVDSTNYCNASGNVCSRVEFVAGLTGDYFVRVRASYSAETGSYKVRVLPRFDQGLVRGAEGEPDDVLSLAQPIAVGTGGALTRTFAVRDSRYSTQSSDQDFFRFSATAGRTYVAEVLNVSTSVTDVNLIGYNSSGTTVDSTNYCNATGNTCSRVQFTAGLSGDYFIRAKPSYSDESGTYTIRVLPRFDEGLVHGADGEPDDVLALASTIDVGLAGTTTRTLSARNPLYTTQGSDQDFFRFSAPAGRTYVVEVFNASASLTDASLYAYDAAGTVVASTSYCNSTGSVCNRVQFTSGLAGNYFVRVKPSYSDESGTYSIRVLSTPTGAGAFVPLTPARLLDTRTGVGRPAGVVPAGGEVELQVSGRGGVPSGASSVALNVTVTSPTRPGNITVFPSGTSKPVASNLNFRAGQTIPNLVAARLGTGGKVRLANNSSGTVNLIADVSGYYVGGSPTAAGSYVALAPSRVLDTRSSGGPVAAGGELSLAVAGAGGVPGSGASSVVLNVTVTAPTRAGNVTAYASGSAKPVASNLNFVAGDTIPNLVVAPIGPDGRVILANNSPGTVQLIADVAGYFRAGAVSEPGMFVSLAPARVLDTRTTGGALASNASRVVQVSGRGGVPSSGATAVVMNTTVTSPTSSGNLTVYPNGVSKPLASNLNFTAGLTIPNLVMGQIGVSGRVVAANNSGGTVHVIADVAGYYLAG